MFNLKESPGSKYIVTLKYYQKTKYVDNKIRERKKKSISTGNIFSKIL